MARRHDPRQASLFGAGGFQPPNRPVQVNSGPKKPEGLTPKFNQAASGKQPQKKRPISREQITELQKKLSRPAHTHEMTPIGNVVGSFDPSRDRNIRHQIKATHEALSKQREMARKAFLKAQLKHKAKRAFNKATRYRM